MNYTPISPAQFLGSAPSPMNGNTPWAQRYAGDIRHIITEEASNSDRNLQRALGPSELGVSCDRQVVGKLAGLPTTNHVVDPWPSVVGTAVHAWLDGALRSHNNRYGIARFIPEQRVHPMPGHSGTADAYDGSEQALIDWKCLGDDSLAKVRSAAGPPRKYRVQLLLYRLGYRNLGIPVEKVVLMALPRTRSTLDGMYAWEYQITEGAADKLLTEVFDQTAARKVLARMVSAGQVGIGDIPIDPDTDECYFCPFYRPQSRHDAGPGCPGPNPKGSSE